ncbi:hypothetical protein B0A54_00236 [Friedmanniomyces endolithicus]|uniref:DUF1765-domain-containing protein n=1 Tax=Friedmanniomyces endolithicus TaxID=329885 RepID=A0A4V6WKE5_9PEZI|nr:hypothetical protein LTS09_006923 [Friedmanniomyces endolithicus]KAK0316360.1 hypothetical protein LTR01_000107 [Friedmanniomyces endolithicus]KAK0834535.1 hypothetical protein LTR73_000823 [Friedmanniomyces endolithicus]TKA49569.1 hypothetical protein B0A54_00236 [Friedmanniomyces endolithicus]
MAVSTDTVNGYTIRNDIITERGRVAARVAAPLSREVSPLRRNIADFPRSASYTYLPDAKDAASYAHPSLLTIKGSFSEVDLIASSEDLADITPPDSSGWTTPDEPDPKFPVAVSRDLIAELQRSPKIKIQRMSQAAEDGRSSLDSSIRRPSDASTSVESTRTVSTPGTTPGSVTPRPQPASTNSSLRRFNRRSWYGASQPSSPSRSPSPPKPENVVKPLEVGSNGVAIPPTVASRIRKKSLSRRKEPVKDTKENLSEKDVFPKAAEKDAARPLSRASTLLRRKSRKTTSLFGSNKEDDTALDSKSSISAIPRVPSLPKSFSTDRLPSFRSHTAHSDRAAPMPRLVSTDRMPSSGLSIPIRKRDELWNVFRTLDGDYTKFSSKSVAFKANVVRAALLPFLRQYVAHASNQNLRPEDLDRRVNILNKWWTGLIEMLHGRNNQSISGTDRPVILDGISGIMERSEFRLAPSPFCPLSQRKQGMNTPRNRSNTSLSSGASEFLTESVHHNVRNIFIQNLSAQMAFVVDKMSLRNASASLVVFCGKACAYAFMFVPSMADVLARLWDLQMDTLRRVLDSNGVGKFDSLAELSPAVSGNFPPALQQLGFTSLMKYMRKLRTPPPLPLGTTDIQWWGHWLERWTGRESDLFYVFVKHFHILVTDFLPPDFSRQERMCAPGVLLVHAQILVNLDATIHRETNHHQRDPTAVSSTPTFDDVLAEPDAVASALVLPPTNAIRIMAENRLIMLIRDFLSERTVDHPIAREFFAESFNDLLQTAAKGTSIFDHAACYTLLDFLEEALTILVRYEHIKEKDGNIINSEFWQSVCKKMISSHNTMTEVRLYAFLYTIWNTVVCDLGRKSNLCLGMLLDEEIFTSRFNHWCPMVRAYYMRLLCWRVGRFDGEEQHGDKLILETLLQRLQLTWSHYLYLREHAAQTKSLLPPSNPCNPAPGRRLLIIRTDTQLAPGGSFLSFDGLSSPRSPPPTAQPPLPSLPLKRFSTLSHVVELDSRPETSHSSSDSELSSPRDKGIGGFLRKMIGGSRSRSKSQGPAARPKIQLPADPLPASGPPAPLTRSATEDFQTPRSRSLASDHLSIRTGLPVPQQQQQQHRNFSFKFSLEFHPNTKHAPGPMRLYPPRLPMPAQMFLQDHSQKMNLAAANLGPVEPVGEGKSHATYCGRALAEWTVVVGECQSFFERRKHEGVPGNRGVETPTLGVEVFRRPS